MTAFSRLIKVTAYKGKVNKDWFDNEGSSIVEITKLRVKGKIEKNLRSEPDKATITINNLSENTRNFLEHKPVIMMIEAGYDNELSTQHLFTGDLRWGTTQKTSRVDIETELELADGDRAFKHARVSKSFKSGTTILMALREIAKSLNLKLSPAIEANPDLKAQFSAGVVLQGRASLEMNKLLSRLGYNWVMQNGKLLILKNGDYLKGEVRVIDENSGMIGSPEFGTPDKSNGVPLLTVNHLLDPYLMPGKSFKLISKKVNGFFYITRVTHDFDTHGPEWNSTIEAKPL